jgi:hypothetical protein
VLGEPHQIRTRVGRFVAMSAAVGSLLVWGLPAGAQAASPAITTDGATATSATSALINGNGDPEGHETTLHAGYALASEPWCTSGGAAGSPLETAPQDLGSGSVMLSEISVELQGLAPGSEYCAELIAHSDVGTTDGGQVRFVTSAASVPPSIQSERASNVTEHDATLEAQIAPGAHGVLYQFQVVGEPDEYRSEIACPLRDELKATDGCQGPEVKGITIGYIPAGSSAQSVSLDLVTAGMTLQPGTTYHYRVLAATKIQTEDTLQWETPPAYGPDQTFTTLSPPVTSGGGQTPAQGTASLVAIDPAGIVMLPSTYKPPKLKGSTNAQKLAQALKACKRKPRKQQASCKKQAEKKYGIATKRRGRPASKGRNKTG